MQNRFVVKRLLVAILFVQFLSISYAQDAINYQLPPKEIADLLLAKPTPTISVDSKAEWMLVVERNSYPTVEELGQPEVRLAGLRLNPNNFSPSRQSFINNFQLKNINSEKVFALMGMPVKLMAGNISWSPNEQKIAFTNTTNNRVDIYVIDIATKKVTQWNKQPVNTTIGNAFTWLDDNTILYKAAANALKPMPKKPITPKGPTIQQNIGKAAPSATFQDLIKSPYDEQLFDFMATAQLVQTKSGIEINIGKPAIYSLFTPSPDKKYLLTKTIHTPFSYLVTANGFPATLAITDFSGNVVKVLAELPSTEGTPSGYDNTQNVPRLFDWRDDEAATITWCVPLDSGLIKKKVDFHDQVFAWAAPFNREVQELFKTKMRYRGTTWGDKNFAWVTEGLTAKQIARVSAFNTVKSDLALLFERNTTDAYGNPGTPVTEKNYYGRNVVKVFNNSILLNNNVGSSPDGDLPFLANFDLTTKKSEIIWRCQKESFEYVSDVIDAEKLVLLTRRESQQEPPNYIIKNLKLRIADRTITDFKNPYPQLVGVTKEKIQYKREDGVDLTGDLYLPKGYDKNKDGELPVLIWAYPREFNNASDAAQIRGSKYRFTTLSWGSPIFYVTQGYAVLDNAEMPIVSASADKKPNDDFIEQLKLNAEAAVQKLSEMGVGDRNRVAVGGHSYGAFMTANLLAHTNLFKAGIARSGAYNRTLTPFGFQNEERTYWQAPQLYYEMSPFSYADKIKTPLLLIHGDSDDNPGTFPINSERLYNAIKGHGGTVRFVYLPYEAHSYRGKENLLHMLWEQGEWLNKYVKGLK